MSDQQQTHEDGRWQRFATLRDAALDGRLAGDEIAEFESLVLGNKLMRKNYVEHAHQQAVLHANAIESSFAYEPAESMTSDTSASQSTLAAEALIGSAKPLARFRWLAGVGAIAAAVAVAILAPWDHLGRQAQFARISSARNCVWADSTLATALNQPLGEGSLNLEAGIATLQFSDVTVTLEGRVELEILDASKCFVRSGRVLAKVSPGGEGFEIQTPTATFIDRGTAFGVNVMPSGTSDLTVFEGRVDVEHRSSLREQTVGANERVRATAGALQRIAVVEAGVDRGVSDDSVPGVPVHISSAFGDGEDHYLSADEVRSSNSSTTALLVKEPVDSAPGERMARYRRKAFIRIDLSEIGSSPVVDATFQLQGVHTGIGFASMMPDATFAIYGVTDESQDHWAPETISWLNCPANAGDRIAVDTDAAELLGRFVVPQSSPLGRFEISGESLLEFLRSDTNGRVTFVVIPETIGDFGDAYVHGFASKRHPYMSAPTLRLRVLR